MKQKLLFFLLSAFAFTSCNSVYLQNSSVFNNADLGSYKTFMMQPVDKDLPGNMMVTDVENIYDAVSKQLRIRGYKEVNSNPDMLVFVAISVKESLQTRVSSSPYPVYGTSFFFDYLPAPGFYSHGWYSSTQVSTVVNHEGDLMIDLVDAQKNMHIFCAEVRTPSDNRVYKDLDLLQEVAETLFSEFPMPVVRSIKRDERKK